MRTTQLTETAFRATFTAPMREITGTDREAVDIGPYVDAIPADQRDGLELQADAAHLVWRDAYLRYDHVLLPLARDNRYLVIVVNLRMAQVEGHHLLDLGAFCGDA